MNDHKNSSPVIPLLLLLHKLHTAITHNNHGQYPQQPKLKAPAVDSEAMCSIFPACVLVQQIHAHPA